MPFEMVEVSVGARQGDSGGPILNDRGELAGVLFGASRGTTTGSHSARIRRFLQATFPQHELTGHTPLMAAVPQSPLPLPEPPAVREREFRPETPTDCLAIERSALGKSSEGDPDVPPALATQPQPVDWAEFIGNTPFEQAKTVLACVGLLTILLNMSQRASHRGGSGPPTRK
jgi:hypothetical protein